MKKRVNITIKGAVQGVGFRPYIYRLACENNLTGFISNSVSGVIIDAEGNEDALISFILLIEKQKPPHSFIQSFEYSFHELKNYTSFEITESLLNGNTSAIILPDIAVCSDCLNELFDIKNRRYLYPFINCTHCGPRYSIIESLPYDRSRTSMKSFKMCDTCRKEYEDPFNRRFHAEPIACPECGPRVMLFNHKGEKISEGNEAIENCIYEIFSGKIIALKGIGGYQLMCNASRGNIVNLLRARKHREEKPFAVMVPDLNTAKFLCEVNLFEERLLTSSESPVVLLHRKKFSGLISDSVAPNNPYLGIMLPYSPLHHLIMRGVNIPVIATSGNISEEPMCINEQEAFIRLKDTADYFLIHNREIIRPVDDSVARIVKNREFLIRRARGYAPLPVNINTDNDAEILALGGNQKSTVALKKGKNVFVSQHIGDMECIETEENFKNVINDLCRVYDGNLDYVAYDMHPDYASSKIALNMQVNRIAIQHHHAHAAACYYENQMEGNALAVCWDGSGYGTDHSIWGGEFFLYDGVEFNHVAKFKDFKIPGNNRAMRDIKRSAAGILYDLYGGNTLRKLHFHSLSKYHEVSTFVDLLCKDINCFRTSSAGRIFDAVAWLLGICREASFEGKAAMQLEFAAGKNISESYPFEVTKKDMLIINWHPVIEKLLQDITSGLSTSVISAKFHNTLIRIILSISMIVNEKKVLLTGGCFQNMYLLNGAIEKLQENKFIPYWHQRIPANDGGISYGQAACAAAMLNSTKSMEEEYVSGISG